MLAFFFVVMFSSPSVARDAGINFSGPALDAAGHGLGAFDTLRAEPRGRVQAAHAVVAEEHHLFGAFQALQVRGNIAEGNQHRAGDAGGIVFPLLANVHKKHFGLAGEKIFYFARRDFDICHWVSAHQYPKSAGAEKACSFTARDATRLAPRCLQYSVRSVTCTTQRASQSSKSSRRLVFSWYSVKKA